MRLLGGMVFRDLAGRETGEIEVAVEGEKVKIVVTSLKEAQRMNIVVTQSQALDLADILARLRP